MAEARLGDTILAPITGSGKAAVSIVRLSGPDAVLIARRLFPHLPEPPEHSFASYGPFSNGDDGYALFFEAGRSYTGEETVELMPHGSPASVRALIEAGLAAGARFAAPGEFTMRAFQNGRIDLTQAEGVRDLIEAETELQLRQAAHQRSGSIRDVCLELSSKVAKALAVIEASVDFSEEIGDPDLGNIDVQLSFVQAELQRLLSTARVGRILREGYRVAIVGPPNAGKSSLFNRVLGYARAIVTDTPGTTRDVLQETIDLDGIPTILMDTAGLRETSDQIERLGIERSRGAAASADLVWFVTDGADGAEPLQGVETLHIVNKIDLGAPVGTAIGVSAHTGAGVPDLLAETAKRALAGWNGDPLLAPRHAMLLSEALESVANCREAIQRQAPYDLLAADLRLALSAIGGITGESPSADLLERIFADFCIGK